MPYQQDQGPQNYNQSQALAMNDQVNRAYRQRLVQWWSECSDLRFQFNVDILGGRDDRDVIYRYASSMMSLWQELDAQVHLDKNKETLKDDVIGRWEKFSVYNEDIKKFFEVDDKNKFIIRSNVVFVT